MLTSVLPRIVSNGAPRSRILSWLLIAIFLGLLTAPFITSGAMALNTAATICVYIVGGVLRSAFRLYRHRIVCSYDVLRHWGLWRSTGLTRETPSWTGLPWASSRRFCSHSRSWSLLAYSLCGSVPSLFHDHIAVASFVRRARLCQLSDLTGGEDGKPFSTPDLLSSSFTLLFDQPIMGRYIDGKVICYYLVFIAALLLFLFMLRVVNSPFGRVLQAIRENDFRAGAMATKPCITALLPIASRRCLPALLVR